MQQGANLRYFTKGKWKEIYYSNLFKVETPKVEIMNKYISIFKIKIWKKKKINYKNIKFYLKIPMQTDN